MPEEANKPELPPYPDGILEWSEEQKKHWKYTDDENDVYKRVSFKLWQVWLAWVDERNDNKLIDIISKQSDKDSDEYYLKQHLVYIIDRLGKVLGQTNITEEIVKCTK